jgi:hypothetical protein
MIPIQDENEFKRLLEGLANDIVDAHIHYGLYKDLRSALIEFPLVVAQSNTFWTTTLKSHLNTSLYMLTKAYDQQTNALHLFSFLQTIKTNSTLFTETNFRERKKDNPYVDSLANESRIPDLTTLETDLSLCSKDNPLVNTLIVHRGNAIAHRNAKNTAKGRSISETHPLTWEDFELLLNRAIEILNKYSSLFEASTYSTRPIGADDFRYIFECVNSAVEQSRQRTLDLINKHKAD